MSRPFQLITTSGQRVEAQIVPMALRHYVQVDTVWKEILAVTEQPDAAWNWDYKLRQSQQQDRYEAYAFEVDEFVQGLILIETQWHRSQTRERWRLVYVEALASAPWNRIQLERPPWLRGVGRRLLRYARLRSVQLGYEGRLALHALPTAEAFYQRLGMPDYGADDEKDGLTYFEYGVLRR